MRVVVFLILLGRFLMFDGFFFNLIEGHVSNLWPINANKTKKLEATIFTLEMAGLRLVDTFKLQVLLGMDESGLPRKTYPIYSLSLGCGVIP